MRLLIQRVSEASVSIGGALHAKIGRGLLVFTGIEEADGEEDIQWLVRKLLSLRIFPDDEGVMNLPVTAICGDILIISQFTLHASTRKGNRPSYIRAARPETAIPLYERFLEALRISYRDELTATQAPGRDSDPAECIPFGKQDQGPASPGHVASGIFGANMQVTLVNDGPVTLWIDSKNRE